MRVKRRGTLGERLLIEAMEAAWRKGTVRKPGPHADPLEELCRRFGTRNGRKAEAPKEGG